MIKKIYFFFTFVIVFTILLSCNKCNKEKKAYLKADDNKVSEINVKVKIMRYETQLFIANQSNFKESLTKLLPDFSIFLGNKETLADEVKLNQLKQWLNMEINKTVFKDVMTAFPNLNEYEEELSKAFKYLKYYYPEKRLPKIITYISGLGIENSPVSFVGDSLLLVAIDCYLGKNYNLYRSLKNEYGAPIMLPDYLSNYLDKKYIVVDCIKAIAKSYISNEQSNNSFLNKIIYEGKILYFTDAMLPQMADSIKTKYTSKQMEWCYSNETKVWKYFVGKNVFYTNDQILIRKFTDEAPFTKAFDKKSPARVANWIGWNILKNYMIQNKNINFKSLIEDKDYQSIFIKSNYKPNK